MINTREIAEEYRLTHWAQVMQERTQSGLSIKAFCKQIGICGNTYFYWQRRVRAAAAQITQDVGNTLSPSASSAQNQAQTTIATVEVRPALPAPIPNGWTQVQTAEEPQDIAAAPLPVEIGRYRIMVSEDTTPELLEKVCRALVSLC